MPPPITLIALEGPAKGRRFVVEPGHVLSAGRSNAAWTLPEDPQLSALHFSVASDDAGWILRDEGSRNGTRVNGLTSHLSPIGSGARIDAGNSIIGVRFGRHPEPSPAELFLDYLRDRGSFVFVLLDAAAGPQVSHFLTRIPGSSQSLLQGPHAAGFDSAAPHLAVLATGSTECEALVYDSLNAHWVFWFFSAASFPALRLHWRRFLLVRDESGRELYFRFYDPRVVVSLLATLTPAQRAGFFGPVEEIVLPGSAQPQVLRPALSLTASQT